MLVDVALPLALVVIMLSLGVGLTGADFARVAAMPRAVAVGVAMQIVGLPLLALLALAIFPQPPDMAFGVMLLAACPGGVTCALLTRFAGGNVALSVTLTALVSLMAVVTVPGLLALAAPAYLGTAAPRINVTGLAITMAVLTAAPVLAGMALRARAPGLAARIAGPLSSASTLLFVVILLAAIAANWAVLVANIGNLLGVLVLLNLLALAAGQLVGRVLRLSDPDATAIAVELGVQNATLGIAVAGLIAGAAAGLASYAIPPAIYGVTMYLVTLPFVFWRMRRARGL